MTITVLSEAELRRCVSRDSDAVEAVEGAFRGLGEGEVVMPPILSLDIHDANGEMDVKTAYVPGLESFALKVSTGFFDNPKLGLPSLSGLMTLLSAKTGRVEAVLLDNGYLTDVRTAAAGAVAAKHLAREDASVAGILGTGLQAKLQLQALTRVRATATPARPRHTPRRSRRVSAFRSRPPPAPTPRRGPATSWSPPRRRASRC